MSDAVLFAIVFVGFFILRLIAATVVFFLLLPQDGRCPNCDAPTVRVQSRGWNLCLPWFRTSWCYECGWHGLLRHAPAVPVGAAARPARTAATPRPVPPPGPRPAPPAGPPPGPPRNP